MRSVWEFPPRRIFTRFYHRGPRWVRRDNIHIHPPLEKPRSDTSHHGKSFFEKCQREVALRAEASTVAVKIQAFIPANLIVVSWLKCHLFRGGGGGGLSPT